MKYAHYKSTTGFRKFVAHYFGDLYRFLSFVHIYASSPKELFSCSGKIALGEHKTEAQITTHEDIHKLLMEIRLKPANLTGNIGRN